MDLSVKDWLIIIGCLLAAAVLLDGYRRMRSDRQDAIRISSRKRREGRDEGDDDLINPELPGGSARVVAVREAPSLHVKRAGDAKTVAEAPRERGAPQARQEPEFGDDDDDILFRDPADDYRSEPRHREEPTPPRAEAPEDSVDADDPLVVHPPEQPAESMEPVAAVGAQKAERSVAVEPPAEIAASRRSQQDKSIKSASDAPGDSYAELLVLNVVAPKEKPYSGADMLQILLACDVRYGKMNIFHRYEKADGTGAVQFSIANLVEPGDFDLDGIDDFTTPGLVFFMNLPGPEKSIKAFDAMVETAKCLVSNLGGELRDQSHSVATKQTLEHYRQRIRDFERRQLTLM